MIYIYTLTEHFDPPKNKNICSNPPPPSAADRISLFWTFPRLSPLVLLEGHNDDDDDDDDDEVGCEASLCWCRSGQEVPNYQKGIFFRTNSFISYHT